VTLLTSRRSSYTHHVTITPEWPRNSIPDWFYGPETGWTVDDLDRLPPDAPKHLELIDGGLVVMSPQRAWHSRVMSKLAAALRAASPEDLLVEQEMTVVCGPRQAPEPDVVVLRRSAWKGLDNTRYHAADVVLAIEVMSPDSELRDTKTKSRIYAEAGIPQYWIAERIGASTVVHTYQLDPVAGKYESTGTQQGRVRKSVPFEIEVDLSESALAP
jgi:Uma2 family endonuclease